MKVYYPPKKLPKSFGKWSLFLSGSIEMGTAVDWQSRAIAMLKDDDIAVMNPRRKDWDASWKQSIDEPKFMEQVTWELDGLKRADLIIVNFVPGTKSPITLLELGLFAASKPMLVVCPEGYWRKGNVDIVCERYELSQLSTVESAVGVIKDFIADSPWTDTRKVLF